MREYLWYFFAYAFLGWCSEVVFAALKSGRFVNRGFLSGPICPIYGFGIVGVLLCTAPLQGNLLWLYLGSVVLTTLLELVTGFAMEKLFHQRWWDYSKMPLNIGGYVCLPFSLIWGIACVLIVKGLHPIVSGLVAMITEPWSSVLLGAFTALFILDVCVAAAKAFKLDRRLSQIDELAAALRVISDGLGETMANGALTLKATDQRARSELQVAGTRTRDTLKEADEKSRAEMKARYTALVAIFERDHARLLKAFPQLRSLRHPDALNAAKEKLAKLRENAGKHKAE